MKHCVICNKDIYSTNYSTLENGIYTICEHCEKSFYMLQTDLGYKYLIDVDRLFYILSEIHKKIDNIRK